VDDGLADADAPEPVLHERLHQPEPVAVGQDFDVCGLAVHVPGESGAIHFQVVYLAAIPGDDFHRPVARPHALELEAEPADISDVHPVAARAPEFRDAEVRGKEGHFPNF